MTHVFIAMKWVEEDDGSPNIEILGVFEREENASLACRHPGNFYFSTPFNTVLPEKVNYPECIFPCGKIELG